MEHKANKPLIPVKHLCYYTNMDNVTDLQPTTSEVTPKAPKRLNPKQKKTIEYWFDPNSDTYGNLWRSAVKAGFRPKYALNLASNKPLWLYETVESSLKLEQEHIVNGVRHIATKEKINSRSPDDTRLNALTQLGKWSGMEQSSSTVNVNIVQPILSGASVRKITEVEQAASAPNPSP